MNSPRGTTRGIALSAILGMTLMAVAGCGESPAPKTPDPVGRLNQALHDRLPTAIRAAGTITVGTDASYAPASFFGPNGRQIVGFEPDLGAALGKVLGVRFEFVNVEFTTILPKLMAQKVDLAISAMTDTSDREKQADFINYFSAGTSIVVQRGNPKAVTDLQDLCGHVVAVEEGTVQVDLLQRSQQKCAGGPIKVKQYPTNSDALVQLRTGRAVAVLNDFPPASYLASEASTKANYQLASNIQYEPGLYGIAVAKDQTQLRDAIRDALKEIIRTGAYAKVLNKWSVTDGAIRQTTINSGRGAEQLAQ
jgi:polar amino acid transport system substrate-binding protein